jgi:hypothetical protein
VTGSSGAIASSDAVTAHGPPAFIDDDRLDIRPDWVIHCAGPPFEDHLGIALAHQDALK